MKPAPSDPCEEARRRFDPQRAFRAQRIIAGKAIIEDAYGPVRIVAGLDVAYKRGVEGELGVGVAVALSYPSMKLLDCVVALRRICIPYVPGLLAFREMAVLAPAFTRLSRSISIDLVLVDGHGIAHPRRAGIATHVGVVFNVPSIGVAKKRLTGREVVLQGTEYLVDNSEILAGIIRKGRSTIYVSPGHRVSVRSSVSLVKAMLRRARLPEPTRVADRISKEVRSKIVLAPRGLKYIRCSDSSSHSILSG